MLFVLSKLLNYLFSPFIWLLALGIFAFIKRNSRFKRSYMVLLIVSFYFFTCPAILQTVGKAWDITTDNAAPKHYSCAIVLGGYVGVDKTGNGFFSSFSDRFIQAVRLYHLKRLDYLLVSGGSSNIGKDTLFKEADYVSKVLSEIQVPDTAVLKENKARNTAENAVFSSQLLREKNIPPPYLLVTSAFHMRRSLLLFREKGIPVVPYSCDYRVSYQFKPADLLPNVETLSGWNIYIHEMIGVLAYKLKLGSV